MRIFIVSAFEMHRLSFILQENTLNNLTSGQLSLGNAAQPILSRIYFSTDRASWNKNVKNVPKLYLRILDIHGAKITPFQMFTHFYNLWPLGKKNDVHIFDRRSGCKIIKQNMSGGSDFLVMYI